MSIYDANTLAYPRRHTINCQNRVTYQTSVQGLSSRYSILQLPRGQRVPSRWCPVREPGRVASRVQALREAPEDHLLQEVQEVEGLLDLEEGLEAAEVHRSESQHRGELLHLRQRQDEALFPTGTLTPQGL